MPTSYLLQYGTIRMPIVRRVDDVMTIKRRRLLEVSGSKEIKVDARKAIRKKAAEATLRRVSDVNSYSIVTELSLECLS